MLSLTAEEALYALVFIADQDILEAASENPISFYAHAKVCPVKLTFSHDGIQTAGWVQPPLCKLQVALLVDLVDDQLEAQEGLLKDAQDTVHSKDFLKAQSILQVGCKFKLWRPTAAAPA